jgi:hypothetical protein
VPRHREINDFLVHKICKDLEIAEPQTRARGGVMGTYPWGPHGPQSGPHEVTPNPTPSYVPPPSSDWGGGSNWGTSTPSSGGGGYSGGGPVYTGPPAPPRPRSYIVAVFWTLLCGPFALLFYSIPGMLLVLMLMLGYPVALIKLGHPPGYYEPDLPISIWGNETVMAPLWWKAVVVSMVWAVVIVVRYNREIKGAGKVSGS